MVKGGKWNDAYNFIYLPISINPEKNRKPAKQASNLDL